MDETFEVPLTDPIAYFFDESGCIARDPSKLGGPKHQPDPMAIFSVLQFGAILPPLSPWRKVSRYMPGYRYRGVTRIGPIQIDRPARVTTFDAEGQSNEICSLVDNAISKAIGNGPDPVVLFSGGVDSGLIAARLAALGHRNTLLLNYSFGDDDPESRLAEAMAKHLGLRFERLADSCGLCDCLIKPGQVYVQPFADHSTAPTSSLARAVVNRLAGESRLIFDGTGADGAFGMIGKAKMWKRIMQLPAAVRHLASYLYTAGFWRNKSKLEYTLRILRRSATMPLLSAVLAQNSLAGILYCGNLASNVHRLLSDWIGEWVGNSILHRIIAADLAMTCTNVFAQKAKPILENAGLEVHYPFLQTEVVSMALASIDRWQMDEPKASLKRCLARHVPSNMVYRSKSGFTDPRGLVFNNTQFIAHLRAAADSTGPIAPMLQKKLLMKACDLLNHRACFPAQTLNCLWAIVFLDRWYRTAP